MDAISLILIFSSFIITIPALSAYPCKPDSCDIVLGPQVRFPFRLKNRQPARCGYPGFDLYCNSLNQTILELPESGEFVVDHIDYTAQALFINDPDSCLPGRILNFTLSGSPFRGTYTRNYTFLNCSSDYMDYTSTRYMPLFCLSGRNYTVLAMSSHSSAAQVPPSTCRRIASVLVPLQWTLSQFYWSSMDLREDLELVWSDPECSSCENNGGFCGYKGNSGPEIGCFRRSQSGEFINFGFISSNKKWWNCFVHLFNLYFGPWNEAREVGSKISISFLHQNCFYIFEIYNKYLKITKEVYWIYFYKFENSN